MSANPQPATDRLSVERATVDQENIDPATDQVLRIFRRQAPVQVLGPGRRAVIWVQGCPFACPGCIVPESWEATGGEAIAVSALAAWVLAQPDVVGITLSGGEPMGQAAALVALIDQVRAVRDLGVMCYTGDRLERLQAHGSLAQRALLERIDLLVDGPYRQDQHGDLLWRGSHNQRLLALSDRDRNAIPSPWSAADGSAGLEFVTGTDGSVVFNGVPAIAGFRPAFETQLRDRGVRLRGDRQPLR